ncbi:MAG: recombinase family protein, partial [Thiotrichaceae bacterium]
MKRAIGYVRVSTNKGSQEASIEWQQYKIEKFCDDHGYELVDVFSECKSAFRDSPRPALVEALKLREEQDYYLISLAVDRLTRSSKDIQLFHSHLDKIRVVNLGPEKVDPSIFSIQVAAAEKESAMRSERAKWAAENFSRKHPDKKYGNPRI